MAGPTSRHTSFVPRQPHTAICSARPWTDWSPGIDRSPCRRRSPRVTRRASGTTRRPRQIVRSRRGPSDVEVATSAGAAPPWYYVVVGSVARAFSSGEGVMAYRMAAVSAVRSHPRIRRWCAAGTRRVRVVVAAMTPSAWFLIGVVGTSGIEIALVTLALVEAVGRFRDPPLGVARPRLGAAGGLPGCASGRIHRRRRGRARGDADPSTVHQEARRRAVGPLVIAGVATLAWNRWTGLIVSDRRTADSDSLVYALGRSIERHSADGAPGDRRARMERVLRAGRCPDRVDRGVGVRRVLDVHAFVPTLVARSVARRRLAASDRSSS